MSFECLDCKAITGGYCSDCATPNDELRELIEAWEEIASQKSMMQKDTFNSRCGVYAKCADELEELIDDE